VSYLSHAYGGSDVTIDVPAFFKEKKWDVWKNSAKRQIKYPVNLFILNR
jgi:hypothetical protein